LITAVSCQKQPAMVWNMFTEFENMKETRETYKLYLLDPTE